MEIRVLGPLEVVEGDRVCPLGGGRQRALLADLIVHANHVVSADRLVEDVWAGEPSASASHAVHVYVSRLRKVLEGDGTSLVSRPPGYMLEVDDDRIDLTRFENLVAEGRHALVDGRSEEAASYLGDALSLWRGEPFADLDGERFLEPEISRLWDLRLAALEDRIEADLALGRHAEVIPELCLLVDEHPTRERLRAHLMLALYRSGRQADALAAYEEGRGVLAEELGIDPGQELQRLHREILLQDPLLEWIPRVTPTPRTAGVRKLVSALVAVVRAAGTSGEQLDPEALPALLRRVADRVRIAVQRHGGTPLVPGPTGSFPAVFGVPAAHEDDALRAVRAGVELRDDLERLGAELRDERGLELEIRVAVVTGEAVAHDVPVVAPPGEVFASAERLATGAGCGDVLIDVVTHQLVANAVRVEAIAP